MKKRFNIAGTCIPQKHYMADTSEKISRIIRLIEQESYFTISRARQYGKTTTLMLLWRQLKEKYIVINISFEGMGMDAFGSEDAFVRRFCGRIEKNLRLSGYGEAKQKIWKCMDGEENLDTLRDRIIDFCGQQEEVLLFIDEVDKSSDNQMFLNFLGLLRELYLERAMGTVTFKSVILAGVYDVKNLKLKLRPDEERKYNSPWNIAVDFPIDMSLSVPEISAMIREYEETRQFAVEVEAVAREIHHYTSGYPFLVSLICLWMDERISGEVPQKDCWTTWGVRAAVREILKGTNTLFDDMIKNLENNPKFRGFVESILFSGNQIPYKVSNPEINLGVTFGIIGEKEGICKISNIMFETYIYDHFIADQMIERKVLFSSRTHFIGKDGCLDMDAVLEKFQDLMKAEYRRGDESFFEKQGAEEGLAPDILLFGESGKTDGRIYANGGVYWRKIDIFCGGINSHSAVDESIKMYYHERNLLIPAKQRAGRTCLPVHLTAAAWTAMNTERTKIMERHTFAMKVKEGQMDEYRRRLGVIWPELTAFLDRNQVKNFSIWNAEAFIFGYYETAVSRTLSAEEEALKKKLTGEIEDTFDWISVPGQPMRLMYHDFGIVRESKELIRHRMFMTKLKPGCEEEYKKRHDGLIEKRGGAVTQGPDSNFSIWSAGGYIFGYDEIDTTMEKEPAEADKAFTVEWETRQLEIMDWITNDVDWLTGEHHAASVRLAWHA